MSNKYLEKIASTAMFRNALKSGASKVEAAGEEWALRSRANSSLQKGLPVSKSKEFGRKVFNSPDGGAYKMFGGTNKGLTRISRLIYGK